MSHIFSLLSLDPMLHSGFKKWSCHSVEFKVQEPLQSAQQTCQKRTITSSEMTPNEVIEDAPPSLGVAADPPVELPTDPQGSATGV